MWRDSTTGTVVTWQGGIRELRPNVSMPSVLSDELIAELGFDVVQQVPPNNTYLETATSLPPIQIGGVWTQQWQIDPLPPAQAQTQITAKRGEMTRQTKSIRDTKTSNGGYLAGGKWFHSDLVSRTQQIGLILMGANIPAGLQWKTLDGSFITMTPTLAGQILAAAGAQDAALFAHAETLIGQIDAAADPTTVDVSAGWPATYGDV